MRRLNITGPLQKGAPARVRAPASLLEPLEPRELAHEPIQHAHDARVALPRADELGGCCGQLGRVAARVTSLHHSWLALEPSMALASFNLSLLIQVHEAAAVVASGSDAGAPSGDSPPPPRVRRRAGRGAWRGWLVHHVGCCAPDTLYHTGRRLLLVEVRLLFTNDYSRPTFAFAAPVRCRRAV